MIAIDIGFGWTKCFKEDKEPIKWKFPTWIAYWNGELSEVKAVSHEGKEYVVGEVARHSKYRIEIVDFADLVKWSPVIIKHTLNTLGENVVIGGIPPKYQGQYQEELKMYKKVHLQGLGILADVESALNLERGETVLVLDVGFNTINYFLVMRNEKEGFDKIRGGTMEDMGILRAVELFRSKIENEVLKNLSRSQIIKVFEKGMAKLEGREIEFKEERELAIEIYSEVLSSRLKSELSVIEVDRIVLAGGGAYLLSSLKKLRQDIFIPLEPEFSNVRGYLRLGA